MRTDRYIDLLRHLIEIPSVSGQEKDAADYLEGWLVGEGLAPHRLLNNVWLESEPAGTKPTLLLNAHIDTVKPAASYTRNPFESKLEGDILYGLGSNDDGGSLVALLAAFSELASRPQPYRLVWSATAQEENSGTDGFETILPQIGEISLAIVGEPTGMRMAVAERGLIVLDCTATGKSGHAARDEGDNAIYRAVKDIGWFRSYEFDGVSPYLGRTKMTVTMINAGTQHNVIPDRCDFVVDIRPNGLCSNEEILETIRSHVTSSVVPRSMRHSGSHIGEDSPVVIRGRLIGLESFGSPTLSNATLLDCPALKIGPGESSRSHSADEYILVSEINAGIEKYVALLDRLTII